MPIVYDKKTSKWVLRIKDEEEHNAVLEIGKQVILGEISEDYTKRVYHKWLDIPLKHMFTA